MADDEVRSVREDLEAAFEAAETSAPAPPKPVSRETKEDHPNLPARQETRASRPNSRVAARETSETSQSEPEAGPEEDQTGGDADDKRGDRPRDQFGRFLSSTPPAKPPERAEAQPETAETKLPDQPEPETAEPEDAPAILPPQAWSGPAKDNWGKLPRSVQEEVDRRERDVQRAFQERAERVNVLEPIAAAIQPYSQKLALRGINPAAVVQQLLAVQDLLETDPVRGVAHVARAYGVDLRNYASAYAQAQQPQDPAVRELAERVAQQDQMLRAWAQGAEQQEMTRINGEVQAFAADSRQYPYFEHVRVRMAQLMESGAASTLAQAYRLACADNDDISRLMQQQREQAQRQQRTQAEKQAAERARRAAVSVSGNPYGGARASTPKKNGSVRDDILDAYDAVADR